MGQKDARVDAYIERSAFAPILQHLRGLVHKTCPQATETIKWGFPHFEYKGILCSMASFKQHCSFGFWKAAIMDDPHGVLQTVGKTAMGHFGQITDINNLPPDKTIIAYIKAAMKLNEEGINVVKPKTAAEKKELVVPDYFQKALAKNKKALKTFEALNYSNKKDYIEWITEAKTTATKDKRMATALEWLAEGKVRNWKYVK